MEQIPVQLFDADGALVTGPIPDFLYYGDRAGVVRPVIPSITLQPGGGAFIFTPSQADEDAGTIWVIQAAAGLDPAFVYGSLYNADAPFQALLITGDDGSLVDLHLTPPTLGFYKSQLGPDLTPVVPVNVHGGYLWSVTPNAGDLAAGVRFDIMSPAGYSPTHLLSSLMAGAVVAPVPVTVPTTVAVTATSATVAGRPRTYLNRDGQQVYGVPPTYSAE